MRASRDWREFTNDRIDETSDLWGYSAKDPEETEWDEDSFLQSRRRQYEKWLEFRDRRTAIPLPEETHREAFLNSVHPLCIEIECIRGIRVPPSLLARPDVFLEVGFSISLFHSTSKLFFGKTWTSPSHRIGDPTRSFHGQVDFQEVSFSLIIFFFY